MTTICLESVVPNGKQLHMSFSIDHAERFSTTYWYDFRLDELDELYGKEYMKTIYFHCAVFQLCQFVSVNPSDIDLGAYSSLLTDELAFLWGTVVTRVFGEWRYKHAMPDWKCPSFRAQPIDAIKSPSPKEIEGESEAKCLAFCGGGKDSLVALKLLESIDEPYSSLSYSHSIYGRAARQHELIDRLLDRCAPTLRHSLWIYDDFLDSPALRHVVASRGIRMMTGVETPASLFAALPLALRYGYTILSLAHERSANVGNLIWNATGEEINHQWGKSLDAQRRLRSYIQSQLVSNLIYFSPLMTIHDPLIFWLVNSQPVNAIAATHSCNIAKPWCRRCPKCCYVWLGYRAYVSLETTFGGDDDENLFDVDENLIFFRQMLGLDEHTPFECLGGIDESRLAFELCRRKGFRGKAIDAYVNEVWPQFASSATRVVKQYVKCHEETDVVLPSFWDRLRKRLEETAATAQAELLQRLEQG
ncbi:UDP-N-acetyl-alpha-D-muramoyl-L-alanyl-L-glutamate epimerase-like [Oscarella lobularis]|uniref:UDP-N-acetyl-alpha-D-muramoyl-L-alanyl-L- glutamate epimerase-like n=1 Tax=Oscarella lobularis TaxID=121494 RepID=UPI003313F50E